ncbi:MAG: RnfABCDGE type electron transport complex subunit D [Alicyclobacillaceae bacterium]|nr:RnfABCDGE type electron transport complex subunit D [Alicyclobacillaceae bacterium]
MEDESMQFRDGRKRLSEVPRQTSVEGRRLVRDGEDPSETAMRGRRLRGQHRKSHSQPVVRLRLWRVFNTPKRLVLFVLLATGVSAAVAHGGDVRALSHLAIGLGTGWAVDFVVDAALRHRRLLSDGGMVTGVIVSMVLGAMTPGYVVAATTAIALASKHILRRWRKPVFNPAAVGLLVANYAFLTMQSWWGGMSLLPNWTLLVLSVPGVFIAWRVKRIPQVVSFAAVYAGACLGLSLVPRFHMDAMYGLENPMLNSALFLAFFMLTDPPTSPPQPRHQVWFGAVAGLVSVAVYIVFPAELSYLLVGLLAANLIQFAHAQRRRANNRRGADRGGDEGVRRVKLQPL